MLNLSSVWGVWFPSRVAVSPLLMNVNAVITLRSSLTTFYPQCFLVFHAGISFTKWGNLVAHCHNWSILYPEKNPGAPWNTAIGVSLWSMYAAIYGVPWIPSIYPLYVSIYTSTMDPMGYGWYLDGTWWDYTEKNPHLGWFGLATHRASGSETHWHLPRAARWSRKTPEAGLEKWWVFQKVPSIMFTLAMILKHISCIKSMYGRNTYGFKEIPNHFRYVQRSYHIPYLEVKAHEHAPLATGDLSHTAQMGCSPASLGHEVVAFIQPHPSDWLVQTWSTLW